VRWIAEEKARFLWASTTARERECGRFSGHYCVMILLVDARDETWDLAGTYTSTEGDGRLCRTVLACVMDWPMSPFTWEITPGRGQRTVWGDGIAFLIEASIAALPPAARTN
jgi:hypothetical protein